MVLTNSINSIVKKTAKTVSEVIATEETTKPVSVEEEAKVEEAVKETTEETKTEEEVIPVSFVKKGNVMNICDPSDPDAVMVNSRTGDKINVEELGENVKLVNGETGKPIIVPTKKSEEVCKDITEDDLKKAQNAVKKLELSIENFKQMRESIKDLVDDDEELNEIDNSIKMAEENLVEAKKAVKDAEAAMEAKKLAAEEEAKKLAAEEAKKEVKSDDPIDKALSKIFEKCNAQLKAINEEIVNVADLDKFMTYAIPAFVDDVRSGRVPSTKYKAPTPFGPIPIV